MEQIIIEYQNELIFGVLLNAALVFGLGLYEALNVDIARMTALIDRYPIKPNVIKFVALLFAPYIGSCYVFYELYILQKAINRGKTVYDYVENKIVKEYARQQSRDERQ
ncbi:MAG: hypothetical protein LBI57_08085 [Helicobacteraceae bacterium]|jgi:hypothetical protein|nr:hypothetical protein [Helicobacteraceae bacterium]